MAWKDTISCSRWVGVSPSLRTLSVRSTPNSLAAAIALPFGGCWINRNNRSLSRCFTALSSHRKSLEVAAQHGAGATVGRHPVGELAVVVQVEEGEVGVLAGLQA